LAVRHSQGQSGAAWRSLALVRIGNFPDVLVAGGEGAREPEEGPADNAETSAADEGLSAKASCEESVRARALLLGVRRLVPHEAARAAPVSATCFVFLRGLLLALVVNDWHPLRARVPLRAPGCAAKRGERRALSTA
jgi:hypothetical protein